MSINGVLEDLPLADVLQFIHLGQRSGTLYLWRSEEDRAEIGFHEGRIIGAWTPEQTRLGDRLVTEGLVSDRELIAALEVQRSEGRTRSIGQVLLERGAVERADIHRLLREQIEETIFRLVTWRHGNFQFEVDDSSRLDDFAIGADELLDLDLNTQMLLLDATRMFDERQSLDAEREAERGTAAPSGELDAKLVRAGFGGRGRGASGAVIETQPMAAVGEDRSLGIEVEPVRGPTRCQVVTDHPGLVDDLRQALIGAPVHVVPVQLREAGNRVPGEDGSPLVVLDLRMSGIDPRAVAALARTRPAAPVICIASGDGTSGDGADDGAGDGGEGDEAASSWQAGATAVTSPRVEAVASACRNLVRVLRHSRIPEHVAWGRRGLGSAQRLVTDVQAGLHTATMALNLMQVVSESVERAVLFLVRGTRMVAVGAFGASADGRPLAETTSGLELVPEPASALRRAVERGEPMAVAFAEAALPPALAGLLGSPASRQAVIFPVLGAARPISVLYTDNGTLDEKIEDIKILELATAQVGVAFENELLVQRLAGRGFESALDEALRELG